MSSQFKPLEWVHRTNIYEVNLRQYTAEGTFNAFVGELPRLKDMGVHTLWLMPIYQIGKENRKGKMGSYYSIQNYTDVNADHGTAADFKNLVKQAHSFGFKIVLDWVANHTAWDHVWTKSQPEFYSRDNNGNFRPPFPDWADVIHLNFDNKDLWNVMIAAMKFWITEFDIDGFRCDMAHLVPLDFWKQARKELDTVKPLFWLAETEEANYQEVFDAILTWEFLHKMESFWRKETDIAGLETVLNKYDTDFSTDGIRVYFTSNHDENSHSGSEYERMGDAALPFAVFCCTWQGIPLVYSGQELPNKKRLKFFEKDVIDWTGTNKLHNFYKTLLHLHSTNPALRAADTNVSASIINTHDNKNVFVYLRKNGGREVLVVLNLSDQVLNIKFSDAKLTGNFKNVFSGEINNFTTRKNFEMHPWEYLVFEK
ncbi:MAG: alpha-amylase family glycosyl hydrolase [Bacteroidota bacterium]